MFLSGSRSVQIITDPDGPKTYGYYGIGSRTLLKTEKRDEENYINKEADEQKNLSGMLVRNEY